MNIMVYFSPETLSNSYILFPRNGSEAILVDPGVFDVPLFQLIDSRKLYIRAIFLTHVTPQATHAIKTIRSLYDCDVYGADEHVANQKISNIRSKRTFVAAGLVTEPIAVPGLHTDSLMYRVENAMFTGDALGAGTMANCDGSYGRAILIHTVRNLLRNMPDSTTVLPLHGPPSTVGIERETNIDLLSNEDPTAFLAG